MINFYHFLTLPVCGRQLYLVRNPDFIFNYADDLLDHQRYQPVNDGQ